jgi:transcriptional regulator with XRE-family HTH domain
MRHRDGGNRRYGAVAMPASVPELARTLRRARTRQGLRLEDVSARTGLPLDELERLESGVVGRLDDRVATVKALRTFANALGLSGDHYALSLVEHWPADRPTRPASVTVGGGAHDPTGTVAAAATAPAAAPTAAAGATTAMVPQVTTAAITGPLPAAVAVGGPQVWSDPTPVAVVDTGSIPAVSGVPHRPRRHRPDGTPVWLRVLVGVVAVAVLVGVAGLVVQAVQPSWLRAIGITHAPDHPGTTGPAPRSGTSATSTTAATQTAGLRLASTTPTAATFTVRATTFTVETSAVGNPSWVQITEPGQSAPLYAGVLEAGQSKSFSTQHALVVEIGSSAAHLFVSSAGKNLGFYFPKAAPYTVTFNAAT